MDKSPGDAGGKVKVILQMLCPAVGGLHGVVDVKARVAHGADGGV